ncbi:MAG: seryl-tRNA synthetase [Acidimicrobiia bacterium]|jgi:seryl-tRNA synthetase|nr:seryl-tRNA synthetase [Acidimicrobiia bacterium]
MIDLRRLRSEPDRVRAQLARRGIDLTGVERVLALDAEQRQRSQQRDETRSRIRELSQQVGQRKRQGDEKGAEQLAAESRELGDEERKLAAEVDRLAADVRSELLVIPNLPSEEAPEGRTEHDNVVVRVEGYDPDGYAEHQRVPHWDIGAELGILDLERGAKLSGSMFVMYRKGGASLVRALVQLALDRNSDLFEEIRPPTLVLTETMVSTGHLPKFADDAYHLERDDLWAIPTAEVPLTSLARDEVLAEEALPLRFMAHTSCFRREAGSAGRDTRGLLRVHEFDKVEILAYATPAQAADLHAELLSRAEGVIRDLGLAYRILDLCTGDLGASSARTFDIEVYAPGVDRWLEVSSVSWFSDYQARRANVRYRPAGAKGTEIVHTLNGSALAVPRVWAALVETYRRPDGQVTVPDVLRPYLGGRELLSAGPSR